MAQASGIETLIVESRELLDEMESALLAIEDAPPDRETINAIFRAAHTIKGGAGLFGLEEIVRFTHVVENVLDLAREGLVPVQGPLVALLLASGDHIRSLIDELDSDEPRHDPATTDAGVVLIRRLQEHINEPVTHTSSPPSHFHLSVRFAADVMKKGFDPLAFIHGLGRVGTISTVVTIPERLPPAAEMDPESCYLGFEVALVSKLERAAIAGTFDLLEDNCQVRILEPETPLSTIIESIAALPEDKAFLVDAFVRCETLAAHEAGAVLSHLCPSNGQGAKEPSEARAGSTAPRTDGNGAAKTPRPREASTREGGSIRVDAAKLDTLINLVGELIIATASTDSAARRTSSSELLECTTVLSSLVAEVRDSALQLRMVKIGETFRRYQRVVHDVSRELDKKIQLKVSGEDTELDKTVIERIGDPLLHLVRNAMDHGIEAPAVRAARGKPETGTVHLDAYHDSGSIVITVSDDGAGLKREAILQKAIDRGIVDPGQSLSDSEIFDLVFEPGFSTAEQVTNLSGRGVGMDVVKRNITALRGSVSLSSEAGSGTAITIRLPLTLAIINGFLVSLGTSVLVVPLDLIEECIELGHDAAADYTELRGHVLPFIRLRGLFGLDAAAGRRESVVVVRHAGTRFGLVVDGLIGEFQTVIKPLNKMFNRSSCVSGASILGNGDVALILDVPGLIREATERSQDNLWEEGKREACSRM